MKRAYLDNASTTPIRKEVIKSMVTSLRYTFGNPSSLQHSYGRKARSVIEESRICVANSINSYPNEIIFTSGGTESNNLVLNLSFYKLGVKHVLTSKLEHYSILHSLSILSEKNNVSVSFIKFDKYGIIDMDHMEKILKKFSSKKILVTLMYANNEIGNLLFDIQTVIFLCKKYGAYFHSDTIQFVGNFPIDMKKFNIDFITASAHKFYGPKGVGFIFIRKNILNEINSKQKYKIFENQEYGIRNGTENVPGIVGISKAIQLSLCDKNHIKKIYKLKKYCISQLKNNIPNVIFNGLSFDCKKSIPTILNFLYPIKKIDNLLYFHLDLMGVSVSKGSACSNSMKNISHVIKLIVDNFFLTKMMPIRVSFGIFNEKKDIDLLVESLQRIKRYLK
ncbi:cysteine desulfurase family protein [Blattabacterium cuenoti]|uniref:cysteine desulfurase family protein n=1 Tax=Blattabacterium cuenoti TaxID=1653831 RepID=UPI00163D1922|nr:cysteine desulfurase family protein [Blattabacterium cuenoti]